MTNKDSLKRLWIEFNKLKTWAQSTNPIGFTVESCSLDEDETTSTSTNDNIVTITGLIYPSAEPFTHWALRIEMHVPITYPQKGPEVYMKMNIRHPNIDKNGTYLQIYIYLSNHGLPSSFSY
jgi:ubiquitin-protein ligase